MSHVLIRNPITGGEWDCPQAALDRYLADGWELVNPDPPAPKPEKTNKSKAAGRGHTTAKEQ